MEVYEDSQQSLTQCYFCGEELTPSQLELHVKHCGLVLEPCPDNCGLYVQRQYKTHHASSCKKDPQHLNTAVENDFITLKSEVETMRTNLETELNIRHQQQADWAYQLSKFNQRFQRVEELNNKVINALMSFKKLISEEREARIKDFNEIKTNLVDVCKLASQLKFTITQTQIDISGMKNTYNLPEKDNKFYEEFEAWKSRQEIIVASLKLKVDKELNEEIYKLHKANITRSKSVSDLLDLNEIIIDEQDKYSEQMKKWQQDIDKFRTFLNEENIMISGVWKDQLEEIKKLQTNIEKFGENIKQLYEEQTFLKDKLEKLEIKQGTKQLTDGKEKVEEVVNDLLDEGVFLRKRIEDLEKMFKNIKPTDTKMEINYLFAQSQEEITSRLTDVENILRGYSATLKLPPTATETNNDQGKIGTREYFTHELAACGTNVEQENSEIKYHFKEENHPKEKKTKKAEKVTSKEVTQDQTKSVDVPKKEFENLERLKPSSSVTAFESGRVQWTISNFAQSMKQAKENDEELKGPIFYSSEFGYKFQLRACLNGVGQWKGRHLIVALHVMESEWDALLKWPCRIHVVICLVDQVAIPRKAKDIVKSFTSSPINRHSDYKCLQMFIPHRTLAEHSYIKENMVILKVKVRVISV